MGRMYSIQFENVSVTNAGGDNDLFEIIPGDDAPVKIHWVNITQTGTTTNAQLRISIIWLPATVTGGNGTAVTPQPLQTWNTVAAVAACERVGTTIATTTGTASTLFSAGMSVLTGWNFLPTPDCRPEGKQGGAFVVRLQAPPGADLNMSGFVVFEELG